MDQRPSQLRLTPKQQAIQDLEKARFALARHVQAASTDWNPRALAHRSIQKHRWAWIAGAAAGGLLLVRALMPRAPRKFERDNFGASATKSGLIALILTSMIGMVRQAALKHATQYLKGYLHQYLSRHEGERPGA
jgi:hypothetical protein